MSTAAATENLFKLLLEAAKSNSIDLNGGGSIRPLLELAKEQNLNNIEQLQELLDRSEIENTWLSVRAQSEYKAHDYMKATVQNDMVAGLHRDLQHRYTGRIARILHEAGRKKNHSDAKNGSIAQAKTSVLNFLALDSGGVAAG
jgi:hypothetical protein